MTTTPNYCKVCKTYYSLPHTCRHDVGIREKEMKITYGGGRKVKRTGVEELVFKTAYDVIKIKNSPNGETLELTCNGAQAVLDRNQVHMLYLYLKDRFEPK